MLIKVYCPTGEGGGIDPTCSPGGTNLPKGIRPAIKLKNGKVLTTERKEGRITHVEVIEDAYKKLYPKQAAKGDYLNNPYADSKWIEFRDSFYSSNKFGIRGIVTQQGKFLSMKDFDEFERMRTQKKTLKWAA